ncbi:MAG: helix-turn-helix domain-containing protein [Saprospiraceae bacterium]|nr:helix-turn-helix domain-containing protein [Saprospiraceae bacterium]
MVTKVFSPHPALAPFVQFYLIQQTNLPQEVHCVLACKVLASIQFAFKAPAVTSFHYHGTPVENRVHLGEKPAMIGPTNVFGNAYFTGELNLLAVALQTTGTHYFIKESATAMTNRGVQVELVNKAFNEAQEKLLAVSSPQAAVQTLEPYLIRHFYKNAPHVLKNDLSMITNYVDGREGMVHIEAMAKTFNRSRRWLEKQFQAQIGMSPKAYARAVRFRNVMRHLYHAPNPSWMEVVARFNYTDQSHLIKDFYQYAGNSPQAHFQSIPLIDQNIHKNF